MSYCNTIIIIILLQKSSANAKVGFSKAMSNGWLRVDKSAKDGARVFRKVQCTCIDVCVHCKLFQWPDIGRNTVCF